MFHKHHLAGEKVPEMEGYILIFIRLLLLGQLNIEPHAGRPPPVATLVGRLHDARTTATDHRKTAFRQQIGDLFRLLVIGTIPADPGRPEDTDRRPDPRKPFKPLHELGHNLEHLPGFP